MHSTVRFLRIYIVPGAIFEAITVAGGYGTGREIVQYFTGYGIGGGTLGLLVATLCMGAVLCMTFDFARSYRAYEYHELISRLIGRGWVLYEALVIVMMLMILAVTGAAAGSIIAASFGAPVWTGVAVTLAIVALLNFYGRELVIRVLSFWSLLLLIVFVTYFVFVLQRHDGFLAAVRVHMSDVRPGWFTSGLQYSLYNVAAIPLMLYATRAIETRRQALISGALAAVFTMSVGLLFHLSFSAAFPRVLDQTLPTYWMIQGLGMPGFVTAYIIVLLGTMIKTCAGVVQGFNERLDAWYRRKVGRAPTRTTHAAVALAAIAVSAALSSFGLVTLVARGYGSLAWCFLLVYVLPLFSIGSYLLIQEGRTGVGNRARAMVPVGRRQ